MQMTKILRAGAIASVIALAPAASKAAETWTIQALWGAGSINYQVFERFADNVTTASGGELTIEPLPAGAVVAYNETLEAVGADILQGQHSASVYFTGRDAAFGLLGDLNAAYESPEQMQQWFYYRGGLELARELYAQHNLFYVGPVFWGVESIPVSKPVHSVAEFAGVKLRMPEGPSADLFRNIGAAPVTLPGSEVFSALERGVIDGTDWGTLSMNQDLGYHKIAPYPIYPGIHSMPAGEVSVNMDRWNALSDSQKALLEMAVRDFNDDMINTVAVADVTAVGAAEAEGAEIIDWNAEERKKFRTEASKVWAQYAEKSDMAKKIYESQVAWLKELKLLD